jgi:hypothetical protein
MADLSIPTPTFVAGNTIVASETNANNSAIVTYINNRQNGTTAFDQVKSAAQIQAQALTAQLRLGNPSAFNTIITSPAPTATRTVTLPDAGGDSSFVLTGGTQTISGIKTFDGQLIGKGTIAADSAAVGYIGETVTSQVSSPANFPSTGTWGDFTSVSLTAGHWSVTGIGEVIAASGASTDMLLAITTTSGNSGTGATIGTSRLYVSNLVSSQYMTHTVANVQIRLAATTTVYFKYNMTFASGTPTMRGELRAIRVR